MIDKVRVDQIDIRSMNTTMSFSIHFNCLNVEGDLLPGLGGHVGPDIVKLHLDWQRQADIMIADIREVALWWIRRIDEYSDEETVVTLIFIDAMRYDKISTGGHGINFLFRRDADVFQSALLLTRGDRITPRIRYNQKRWIESEELSERLDTDIQALFDAAETLVLAINKARVIRRKT